MSALSYYLERAGIMTTGISLVRENTVSMQPPRALWVSFPLGRPLGKPDDAGFQHRVIDAALELFAQDSGPILVDYPEDLPDALAQNELDHAPACPVSFAKPEADTTAWVTTLQAELQILIPWHDLGRRRRKGRTLVGVSGQSMAQNVEKLGALLDSESLPVSDLAWFKHAIEDAKIFYIEALTAQPGHQNPDQIQQTFWCETAIGAALLKFNDLFSAHAELSFMARIIAPRSALDMIAAGAQEQS